MLDSDTRGVFRAAMSLFSAIIISAGHFWLVRKLGDVAVGVMFWMVGILPILIASFVMVKEEVCNKRRRGDE